MRLEANQGRTPMTMRPDPTFHASPKLAMEAPPENFAYTLLLSPDFSKPDALAVIDVKPGSLTFSQIVHTVTMPYKGDEFHHFGWNACSSALSPLTGHAFLERRYLIIPGLRSSRLYVVDMKPDPTKATLHKIIEPEEVFKKTGYSRPHTVHCGPEGIYVSTLGGGGNDGTNGPPGVFIMDCETFDILGRWEIDRGPQTLHYDFWWNLPRDYMVTSEWALPPQFENGIVPEDLLSNKYGHRIHFWDLRARRNVQTIDLGANHQMALEVRPAHDPVREYGFLGVVVDTTNLEGSIWTWWREGGKFHIEKTATIPPEVGAALGTGGPAPAGLSDKERAVFDALIAYNKKGNSAYFVMMTARPQTVGYGAADSPAFLAAWMLVHPGFAQWTFGSDPQQSPTKDDVLDNVTLYWLTNSGTSSGRLYWENGARGSVISAAAQKTAEISLPVAITVFPEDVYRPPETWARRAYRNLIYFHEVDKGGHFAAWERPELFSAELRAAFRALR